MTGSLIPASSWTRQRRRPAAAAVLGIAAGRDRAEIKVDAVDFEPFEHLLELPHEERTGGTDGTAVDQECLPFFRVVVEQVFRHHAPFLAERGDLGIFIRKITVEIVGNEPHAVFACSGDLVGKRLVSLETSGRGQVGEAPSERASGRAEHQVLDLFRAGQRGDIRPSVEVARIIRREWTHRARQQAELEIKFFTLFQPFGE